MSMVQSHMPLVMDKDYWQKQFDAQVQGACSRGVRPLLLLHACCAPCSAGVLESLASAFRVVVFYYNPNIAPQEEYERRLNELKRFLDVYPAAKENAVCLETEDAPYIEWEEAAGLHDNPALAMEAERGERCRRCCLMRLKKTKEKAISMGCEYFATTLTLSPHKDASMINKAGLSLTEAARPTKGEASGVKYLVSDFKKRNGFLKSLEASKKYSLYRQEYCGCVCSMRK